MTHGSRKKRVAISSVLFGGTLILSLFLASFVHAIAGIWILVVAMILLLSTTPPRDVVRTVNAKAMTAVAGLLVLAGAFLVWYSYWYFEELLPLSPARVPPYELTGLAATLFGAAATILVGGAMLMSNISYRPAKFLVVGSLFMLWVPVILAYLRYGIKPAFISVDENLVDTLVTLVFVLAIMLGTFGIVLNSIAARPRGHA